MPPIIVGTLVAINYREDADGEIDEKNNRNEGEFYFNEGNFGYFKQVEGKSHQKTTLTVQLSLIKNFLKNT